MTGPPHRPTLFLALRPALQRGRHLQAAGETIRVGSLIAALGPSGLPLVAFLVAIPFVWPLSLGPVTTPASVLLLIIGSTLVKGKDEFPIKEKYLAVPIPHWAFRFVRRVVVVVVRGLGVRHLGDPLGMTPVSSISRKRCAWGIVVGALLLLVPIPFLPLTNTFPAIGVMAFSMGYVGGSASRFQVGVIMCVLGLAMFALYGGLVFFLGWEVLELFGLHLGEQPQ